MQHVVGHRRGDGEKCRTNQAKQSVSPHLDDNRRKLQAEGSGHAHDKHERDKDDDGQDAPPGCLP